MWGGRGVLIYLGSVPLRKKQPNCCASNALNRIYESFSIRFPTHTCSVSTFFLPPVGDSSSSPSFAIAITLQCVQMAPFPFPPPSPPAITSKKMASPTSPLRSGVCAAKFPHFLSRPHTMRSLLLFYTRSIYSSGKATNVIWRNSRQEEEELTRLSKTATLQN